MKQIAFSSLAVAAALVLSTPATVFGALSSREAEIAKDLQAFKRNPSAAMQKIPVKRTADGKIARTRSVFSKADIFTRNFVEKKANWRTSKAGGSSARFAAPGFKDRPETLLDNPRNMLVNLEQMEAYKSGATANQPWSSDYWGFYKGVLATRYADSNFPSSSDWKVNFDYVQQPGLSAPAIFATNNRDQINQLSPAEKYDLLIGLNATPMTDKMWSIGHRYYQSAGHVETWMGICDGWTSASYMLPRPRRAVEALAADGKTMITFYPQDLKALASVLWTWGNYNVMGYVGARCKVKNPRMDTNGRILDEDCFNTNPGSWHQVVVNQLGVNKASIAMDATFDFEVWNQPLHSYVYSYFNPQTMDPVETLAEAAIDVANFPDDKFKQYRSPRAVKIVGIAMDLTYVAENSPYASDVDSEDDDYTMNVRYYYDLELDANNNIVGGEWYQNAHPDFLWRPYTGSRAESHYESWAVGEFDPSVGVPVHWRSAAHTSSAQQGVPLAKIVDGLIAKANEAQPEPPPMPNHPVNEPVSPPTPVPNQPVNAQPSPTPVPNQPANGAQPSPTPVPNQPTNASPTPAPNRPTNASPTPAPNRPANAPSNASPTPAPNRPTNQPVNASPTPAPNRPANQPANASPTPVPNQPVNSQPASTATPAPASNQPANQPANGTQPTPPPNAGSGT